eukprot:CAMPEP_0171945134 /NCGR_PEP_ID=MMETSP0993-20121228/45979_1 /TAXON_ID=483369 /ORGANISM="non described non described, Strain CCMP2098" /LENGTH=64 /DNA_ID=CAMNT_0012588095 /DNA_START=39 /DNA_END=229 /DNA_ORIENTATION=+
MSAPSLPAVVVISILKIWVEASWSVSKMGGVTDLRKGSSLCWGIICVAFGSSWAQWSLKFEIMS